STYSCDATACSVSGSKRSAMRYMVSRQVQNESSGLPWRSASPAIARWNAWECRFEMPGNVRMPAFSPGHRGNARIPGMADRDPNHFDGLATGLALATLDAESGYGLVEDGALAWRDGLLAYAGPRHGLPPGASADEEVEFDGGLATPGLVDCHTHLVFGGDRAREFEMRLQGESYEAIARQGGGILSTVRAVRAASEAELFAQSLPRARALLRDGATTLEIKSGYGLELDAERRMLRVARRIGEELGISVRTTYLGAHALP